MHNASHYQFLINKGGINKNQLGFKPKGHNESILTHKIPNFIRVRIIYF